MPARLQRHPVLPCWSKSRNETRGEKDSYHGVADKEQLRSGHRVREKLFEYAYQVLRKLVQTHGGFISSSRFAWALDESVGLAEYSTCPTDHVLWHPR